MYVYMLYVCDCVENKPTDVDATKKKKKKRQKRDKWGKRSERVWVAKNKST